MDHTPHILFVDDEVMLHKMFERLVARHDMSVTCCSSAVKAVEHLKTENFDLVVTDFMMPDMDGLELLAHIRQNYPDLGVIMITAHANVQHAVRTMRSGAVDYIAKPFQPSLVVERIQDVLKRKTQAAPRAAAESPSARKRSAPTVQFIGEHPSVARLLEVIPKVSQNAAPVFIQGESGTGKEILARLIHESSDRASGPFIAVNCANLPRELVESHLFGHRKGAFTGAIDDMVGAFEKADKGTLLLDEITEIDLPTQAKLLRVLQENEFMKVGASEPQKVDVRVIATSNRNLSESIREGDFREDLYFRISVFPVNGVPLRDRMSDVPVLTKHFVVKYCELYGLPSKQVSKELLDQFMTYSWPGNVRQLENMVQRGVLLSAERTTVEKTDVFDSFFIDADLVAGGDGADAPVNIETIEEMERHMILRTLSETNNNQQLAAQKLGISARTIRNKLKKYREDGLIS
ncbi:MAG: sigma-54-dependent Fis family transcriptional regulator [Rhodothermales bacterium]|nr:sigma-54-dependent Fis family transcriptional regulator [Rhodothermales bacterium]